MTNETTTDPMEFLKGLWGNMGFSVPGMVAPTLDTDELGKRVADLKAVEGWLKSNLSLLQMTIQGLEMQRATLMTLQQMSEAAQAGSEGSGGGADPAPNPFLNPANWTAPWGMMGASTVASAASPETAAPAEPDPSARKKSKPKG
jgi:hypothetical protein